MMTNVPYCGARIRLAAGLATLACAAFAALLAFAQGPPPAPAAPKKEAPVNPAPGKKEVAVITTSMGAIVFEFLPDVAPKMVDNFKSLAKSGFYSGTLFHRVIPGFMIQGGDPDSKNPDAKNLGGGNGPRMMPAEFTTKYSHVRGIVSTARLGNDPNSGSAQFFIMQADHRDLDNKYTIFGRVLEGMDVVDAIAAVPRDPSDRPRKNVVMEKVTVETR